MEIVEGVARCTMQGPTMNAMGKDMMFPMVDILRSALSDEAVRVIVLRGEGGNFSVGADLSMMGEEMDPAYLYENMRLVNSVALKLHDGPKPFITEVDGWAVGGGFSLAIASDITYATERAKFFASFVKISIIPDIGASYFLTERIGLARAKEIAFTGRVIDSEEAFHMGLINRVVPHEEISEEVMKVAGKMAGRSVKVLAMTKRNLNIARKVGLETMLDLEAATQPFMVLAPEHERDVKKFLKKME
ncbi:MAG: enoyl-CoA hydratase/isomerase family protein [Actinobacteria bacterium]|nr:enoyl-CoA hydratase/isomerase family protein [Actinomycetota bacterium]